MTDKQLPVLAGGNFAVTTVEDAQKIGNLFHAAGLFDVSDKETSQGMTPERKQAVNAVKIIAGASMGLSPFAAMKGLHVIKGKVTPGYQTMLALVRKFGYDFKWHRRDNEVADLEIFGFKKADGSRESLGRGQFGTEDMQRAVLTGDNWRKFPRQMRASKVVSELVNAVCPEVLEGTTYTPEDFDACVDGEEDAVTVQAEEKAPPKQQRKTASNATPSTAAAPHSATTASQPQSTGTTTTDPKAPAGASAQSDTSRSSADAPATAASSAAPETQEITDVTPEAVTAPTMADLGQVLEKAIGNGWTQEQTENWMMETFGNNGLDCSSEEAIEAGLSWPLIEACIEYVKENKPQ